MILSHEDFENKIAVFFHTKKMSRDHKEEEASHAIGLLSYLLLFPIYIYILRYNKNHHRSDNAVIVVHLYWMLVFQCKSEL